jgi:serine/threonine protein kinase
MEELVMPANEPKILWPGWETVRLIGRGSYGAVYEIRRELFGKEERAAVKHIAIPQNEGDVEELFDSGFDEASITATFRSHLEKIINEYSLMREMNGSANVVNCDDCRVVDRENGIGGDVFIKMELLTPLTKAMEPQPDDARVIRVGKDICSALILCRRHDIIHRDIKPQNIFLSKNGDYKLGDFGIAKTMEKTSGGTKIGTYKYMAPEIYHNRPYNQTADIYSLGLVLHWLLNERRTPFAPLPPAPALASQEEEAKMRRFRGEPIPDPIHGSPELKRIVRKACAFDPRDRYQSAEEMLRDLEDVEYRMKNPQSNTAGTSAVSAGEKTGRTPAPEPEEEEDSVVGVAALLVKATTNGQTDPAQFPEEDATVGVFGPGRTGKPPVSAGGAPARPPVPPTVPEEDATVSGTAMRKAKEKAPRPRKGKTLLLLAGGLGLAAILAVVLLVWKPWAGGNAPAQSSAPAAHVHQWKDATCTEPRTCTSCGATEGSALGHNWGAWTVTEAPSCLNAGTERRVCNRDSSHVENRAVAATGHDWGPWTRVTEPTCTAEGRETRVCRNNSAHEDSRKVDKLSHDWIEATYDTPKTCRRCGAQEGGVKGDLGELDGYWGDHIRLHGNIGYYSWELYEPVRNCMKVTLKIYIDGVEGNGFGGWYLYGRDLNGKWQNIGEFNLGSDNKGRWMEYEVVLKNRADFDALTVSPIYNLTGDINEFQIRFYAQVYVD